MKECPKETMENEYLKIEMTERSSMLAYIDMINPCINCIGCGDYGVGCCFCQYEEMYSNITTIVTLAEDFRIEQVGIVQADLQTKIDTYEANITEMYDSLCGEYGKIKRAFLRKLKWQELGPRNEAEKFHRSWRPWYRIAMQRASAYTLFRIPKDFYPLNCRRIAGYSDTVVKPWRSPDWDDSQCNCANVNEQVAKLFEANKKIVKEICDFCNEVENIALMKIVEKPFSEMGAGLDVAQAKLKETAKKNGGREDEL